MYNHAEAHEPNSNNYNTLLVCSNATFLMCVSNMMNTQDSKNSRDYWCGEPGICFGWQQE